MKSLFPALLAPPLLALSLVVITACGGDDSASTGHGERTPPPTVEAKIATAEVVDVSERAWVTGATEAMRRVHPGTKILGRIAAVPVDEGERVRRGQVLARLESADLEAAIARAEAAVATADAQLENARVHEARLRELHGRGSVTDKNLEDAVAGLRTAEAGKKEAEAALTSARVMLDYTRVTAPFDGWIVQKRAEAGDMARPGEPLFVVDDLSKVKVAVSVPESVRRGLEEGDPAVVEVLGETRAATVDRVVPAGDPASRTFTARLLLDNPDGTLDAGLYVRAGFPVGTQSTGADSTDGTLVLPASALVERGQLRGVFVVEEGTARLRFLRLGRRLVEDGEERIVVLSGLEPGERYLVDPPAGLQDGTPIREGA